MNKNYLNIDFEELVGKYLTGSALPEEVELLEDIVKSDEKRKKEFHEIKKNWALLKSSKYKFNTSKAWNSIKGQSVEDETRVKPLYPSGLTKKMFAVAATILLLIVGAYFVYDLVQYREKTLVADAKPTHHTLDDGTRVSLNANSTLKYPAKFKTNERRVKLEGEAFFEVESIADQPFIVEALGVEIHVLGTSFSVKAHKNMDAVEVTVYTGKVLLITPDGQQTEIKAGEQKRFNRFEQIIFEEEVIDPNTISWKTKLIIFENTDLNYVFDVIGNTYQIDIAIRDKELKSCRLTASFNDRPLDDILQIIKGTFDLKYVRSGEKIWVAGEACE